MRLSRRRFSLSLGLLTGCIGGALALGSACDIDPKRAPDRQQLLRDVVANVVLPAYAETADATDALSQALTALRSAPTTETLAGAQRSYRAARRLQKSTEAMFYGPADDLTVTGGAIDAWPAERAKLDAQIAGTAGVGVAEVAKRAANQRGFPGIEHLLFDSAVSDAEVLARFQAPVAGARRAELAESLAVDLARRCRAVSDAFAGPGGYGAQVAEAGVGAGALATQAEGVDKLLTGLVYVSERMVMKKLAAPLGVEANNVVQPDREEGPRSDSSLEDLHSDLLGMQAVYTGQRGTRSGEGIEKALRAQSPDVAMRFEQALATAFTALAAVPPPLRSALTKSRPQVEAAYQAIRTVKSTLLVDVANALGSQIGFGFSDTD
jgi:predicted lipoprotein